MPSTVLVLEKIFKKEWQQSLSQKSVMRIALRHCTWGSSAREAAQHVRQLCTWGSSAGEAAQHVRPLCTWGSSAREAAQHVRPLSRWGSSAHEAAQHVRPLSRWSSSAREAALHMKQLCKVLSKRQSMSPSIQPAALWERGSSSRAFAVAVEAAWCRTENSFLR